MLKKKSNELLLIDNIEVFYKILMHLWENAFSLYKYSFFIAKVFLPAMLRLLYDTYRYFLSLCSSFSRL